MIRAFFLLLALALPLRAEVYPAWHDVTGVADDDVLNIRAAPDAASAVIGTLAPDATGIEVIAAADGWGLVTTGESSGYVVMRYLTRSAGPDWTALETPLTCIGTEPFWSLDIDPAARRATFASPEDSEGQVRDILHLWPATPWGSSAGVGLPGGTVVLQGAQCSDGMSDRSYGILVDIFQGDPDTTRLSGCCRLARP